MTTPLNIDITQILLHMLNFVILAGGLTLILYRPVKKFLDGRRDKFAEEQRKNDEARAECERLKNEYEEKLKSADETVSTLRRNAEREMAENAGRYLDSAKAKAETIIKEAEEEAEARKAHILESAQTEIGELVLSATQKLMNGSVTAESDSALYDEFIRTAEKTLDDKGNGDE